MEVSNENMGISNKNVKVFNENLGVPTKIWRSPQKYEVSTKIKSLQYKFGGLQRESRVFQ